MRELDVLLVGARGFGAVHSDQIERATGCRLAGICDRDVPTDSTVPVWEDLDLALGECDAPIVSVVTPTSTHLELASRALREGRYVVVEKPVAATPVEAAELERLCLEFDGWVEVISQRRFQEGPRLLAGLLASGALGNVATLNCTTAVWRDESYFDSPWHGVRSLGGGNLLNHGMHLVDLVVWLLGAPTQAFGLTTPSRFSGADIEESCVATMRFASGVLGVLEASLAARSVEPFRLELRGDGGGAVLTDRRLVVTNADGRSVTTESCDTNTALGRQYTEIARCIRESEAPTVGLADGTAALELAWKLSNSAAAH